MSKLKTVEINIPFAGFYNSVYSDEIDQEESRHIEYQVNESDEGEQSWPDDLRLDAAQYSDIFIRATDYRVAYLKLAQSYVAAFSEMAGEALAISAREKVRFWSWADKRYKTERRDVSSLRLTYAAMESPREYNFTTDKIFANIPVSVVSKLWRICADDDFATLTRVARNRHSSRDGFISFYESDWRDWGHVSTWDYHQLCTLLVSACEVVGFDWQDSEMSLYYATVENVAYSAWESAVDWKQVESDLADARAEKLAAWLDSDPDRAKAWLGRDDRADGLLSLDCDWPPIDLASIPYRCSRTPDLFA